MRRDPRLRGLSSDHHRALVMARKMSKAGGAADADPDLLDEIGKFCREDLASHFHLEEKLLLPFLQQHGENDIVARTLREHSQIMQLVARLDQADVLPDLARLLKQHVQFEERQLFEVCQKKLTHAELEAIAAAS